MFQPKIAIVCDWLTNFGGAERVIEQFHQMFPEAPIFTSLFNAEKMPTFRDVDVRTSYLQSIPGAKSRHQLFLYFYPGVFESFDLSDFDIVISSSHSCAKGVITKPGTLHICYCHSPMRYAWDGSHSYVSEYPMSRILKFIIPRLIHKLRIWDRLSAERVDFFIANSTVVGQRIKKYYQREAAVIFPPVDVAKWKFSDRAGEYFLAVGRLTTYKRFDLLVETFSRLGLPLKIVGTGPEEAKLRQAAGANVEFLGRISDEQLNDVYGNAKALVFPQYEDFGITPLEAMCCGRPVIAFRNGGTLDSVVEGESGLFFAEQTVDSLSEAVLGFDNFEWDYEQIRGRAEKFGNEVFRKKFLDFVVDKWQIWQNQML